MEFKIDTNFNYTLITPAAKEINANLTEQLRQKCNDLTQSGGKNYIIDLGQCQTADKTSLQTLAKLHADCYSSEQSLVFTGVQNEVLQQLKETEVDAVINIAPTLVEAVDIISMEILERDLFNEEF